jgi:phage protein D
MDGEDGFLARTQQEARAYVASEERSKSKRASQRFAARVQDWAKAIGGKERTRMWAESMLEAFAGNESIERRGKKSVDPVVEALCKLAGKPAPKL